MNNYSYLIIEQLVFKSSIENLISEGNSLYQKLINSEEELSVFREEITEWEEKTEKLLGTSFALENNDFLRGFQQTTGTNSYHIPQLGNQQSRQPPLSNRVRDVKETLRQKTTYLNRILRIILECDYILHGTSFNSETRAKYTTKEKLHLLLEKLYRLNDDSYYPIIMLLEGNGIKLRSSNESRELAGILQDDEYIDTLGGLGAEVMARITSKGAMYVEEMGIPHKESYEDIAYDEMEMRDRVDEVLERLNTMGLGQEILFNELQELKEMYGKLNKKNWGQLLKGKLVDLALGKVVENDTIKFVYEQLTGHELKLTGG